MDWAVFGTPSRFEVALRWITDPEPRERRPEHGGWSTGEIRLTVAGLVLTQHRRGEAGREALGWYLLPVFEWFAENWVWLLHEERLAWPENSAAPAATAAFFALRRSIAADDTAGRAIYADVQAWWSRHALQAADSSALYPDLFFRRLGDDIEVSWTARQPSFVPDGFQLTLAPGAATLAVAEVAGPLWEALAWVVSTTSDLGEVDRQSVRRLEHRLAELTSLSTSRLEQGFLSADLLRLIDGERDTLGVVDGSRRLSSIPAVVQWDDTVLMFGGVRPDITASDVRALIGFMRSCAGGHDGPELARHVDTGVAAPLSAPFEEGYALAEQVLDDLGLPNGDASVDVRSLLMRLDVEIVDEPLETSAIRGVALAGDGYRPAILINRTSPYNRGEPGQRFTLAHELFHILFDRSRARRIAHTSGRWASPAVEQRANAFAARLLMPPSIIRRSLTTEHVTVAAAQSAASTMQVSYSALVEHLYNMSMIDDQQRDELRRS